MGIASSFPRPAANNAADTTEARTAPVVVDIADGKAAAALTTREREIALLAAVGNTSKGIARTLTLSVRTVDNHFHHAYTKLGVDTCRELARTLATPPRGAQPDHPHRPS